MNPMWWAPILLGTAILLLVLYDVVQRKHAILRNFPVIGHFRYLLERVGPELRQYIITSNNSERPFSRDQRTWIYTSSKQLNNYSGFGTDSDLEQTPGTIIVLPHAFPLPGPPPGQHGGAPEYELPPAVVLGELHKRAKAFRPQSLINVSGMSFGALSSNAVEALNRGCAEAGALHNTGEGGISPAHLHGGELIFQIGTGYFGCRAPGRGFQMEALLETIARAPVRGIEIKLSQGAKPGHGGILPAAKVTPEIAAIRGIEPGVDCITPPNHSEFSTVGEMVEFIETIAAATGLPVGIKSAVGQMDFWIELARTMRDQGIGPDWITIDGGEGGTGAAPYVYADSVSLPFKIGFARVYKTFAEFGMQRDVPFIGSARLGFPAEALFAMALGADLINVGREALISIGCIQAQRCHTGHCPSGVATQSAWLQRGLVPEQKAPRMANYIRTLRKELFELARTCGVEHPALVPSSMLEMVDEHFHSRTVTDVFNLAADHGMPSEHQRSTVLQAMQFS